MGELCLSLATIPTPSSPTQVLLTTLSTPTRVSTRRPSIRRRISTRSRRLSALGASLMRVNLALGELAGADALVGGAVLLQAAVL
jgi:hypothetical protein